MLDVEVDSLLVGVHPDLHGIVDRPAYDASSTAAMPGVSKQHPPLHRNKDVEQTDCRRSHVGVEDVEVSRGGPNAHSAVSSGITSAGIRSEVAGTVYVRQLTSFDGARWSRPRSPVNQSGTLFQQLKD